MTPAREEALFALAVDKPADKRAAFLEAMCETNVALPQRLAALLAAHKQPDAALAEPAPPTKATMKIELSAAPIFSAMA